MRKADSFTVKGWRGYLVVRNTVVLTLEPWLYFLMLPQPETPQLPACFSSSGWAAHGTASETLLLQAPAESLPLKGSFN